VRTRASASGYFNRTPASATNRTTWTYSAWLKRGALAATNANNRFLTDSSGNTYLRFNSADQLDWNFWTGSVSSTLTSSQVFRDPSAWYHIMVAVDTTQATSTNRVKIYVNGSQVTAFASSAYPAQNGTSNINNNVAHYISSYSGTGEFFDGYLTEINFIDGQALTPSSFGTTNAITGVWQPAKYTGTYGTNGFYLNFSDNSSVTTSSNVGIGKDFSGNGNYWTSNNINVTAYSGSPPNNTSYDSMVDSPTVGSLSSNYAVMNPLDQSGGSVSKGNLRYDYNTTSSYARGTIAIQSGKWYFECTASSVAAGGCDIGLAGQSMVLTGTSSRLQYRQDGSKVVDASVTSYGASYTSADVIGIAVDFDTNSITFYKNNTSQGAISYTPAMPMCPSSYLASGSAHDWNFGQRPFSYTPPTGYVALNTYNLPTSTITNGAAYMAATLYTGNGTSQTIANTASSASFQPDLIWTKSRSGAGNHSWVDSVRGTSLQLSTTAAGGAGTASEVTDATEITAITSTGFSVGNSTGAGYSTNANTTTYVGWQWKAGGTSSSNTNGTITSTVSAGATQGFSVVTYTGNSTSGATIGHGLGVAPQMIIVKRRTGAVTDWIVYHISMATTPQNGYLSLNGTAGYTAYSAVWNNTAPSTTSPYVFSVGNDPAVNVGTSYVAYCFAAVKGYSAFGSYTGNNDPNGPFVFLGFRPRWILVKSTAATTNWHLQDTSRSPYNAANNLLFPNLTNGDYTTAGVEIDILSNGFKIRDTNADYNASGNTFIYAAFAENPFQNALAR
jgi:hypothetical protein